MEVLERRTILDNPTRNLLNVAENYHNYRDFPALVLVEPSLADTTGIACDSHVFGEESWYTVEIGDEQLFNHASLGYLARLGYRSVSPPSVGDVVVYEKSYSSRDIFQPAHYGIFLGNGEVESKFGVHGPVYRHGLFEIPKGFGDYVIFLRGSSTAYS